MGELLFGLGVRHTPSMRVRFSTLGTKRPAQRFVRLRPLPDAELGPMMPEITATSTVKLSRRLPRGERVLGEAVEAAQGLFRLAHVRRRGFGVNGVVEGSGFLHRPNLGK